MYYFIFLENINKETNQKEFLFTEAKCSANEAIYLAYSMLNNIPTIYRIMVVDESQSIKALKGNKVEEIITQKELKFDKASFVVSVANKLNMNKNDLDFIFYSHGKSYYDKIFFSITDKRRINFFENEVAMNAFKDRYVSGALSCFHNAELHTIMIERKYLDGVIALNDSSKELIPCDYDKIMDIARKHGKVLSVNVSISMN